MSQTEYVLGTGDDELTRLGLQHRVWADATVAAWKRAGVGPGSRILDVGCGPGHATVDLAQLVTPQGLALGIDESASFVQYVNAQAKARGLEQLQAVTGDAETLSQAVSERPMFDAVYCRWVLCWLRHPQRALTEMHRLLKPGGRVILHDYFNWKAMTSAPRSPAIEMMVAAAVKSFEKRHGNVDIAADLPRLLREAGFELVHFEVHQRAARGGGVDSMLAWILSWWRTYGPKLVQLGLLSPSDFQAASNDLDRLESDSDQFFFCPPLFEFIARRKS